MESYVLDTNGNIKRINATAVATSETTITATGNIDDLDFSNADLLRMNNATLATIRGLKAGAPGQRVTIASVGAGQVDFSHQDGGDPTPANRLINFVTSMKTSLAAGMGQAVYIYDGVTQRWRLTECTQGKAIAFDPQWSSASNPQPSLGNGTNVAFYTLTGTVITITILLTYGSTTTGGTGEWIFTNPGVNIADFNSGGVATDTGEAAYTLLSTGLTTTTFHILNISTNTLVSATVPFTFETGDILAVAFEAFVS